jgi:hypothetical protein
MGSPIPWWDLPYSEQLLLLLQGFFQIFKNLINFQIFFIERKRKFLQHLSMVCCLRTRALPELGQGSTIVPWGPYTPWGPYMDNALVLGRHHTLKFPDSWAFFFPLLLFPQLWAAMGR